MTRRWALALVLVLLATPGRGQPAPGWQEVIGDLAAERTRAETCVRLLKRHAPDAAALSRGELAYADAKAEMDAIIAELAVVVAEGATPAVVPDLERRLARTLWARQDFCAEVTALVPGDDGARSALAALLAPADAVVEGVVALVLDAREADRLERQTIRIQLAAQRWPAFADVEG